MYLTYIITVELSSMTFYLHIGYMKQKYGIVEKMQRLKLNVFSLSTEMLLSKSKKSSRGMLNDR